MRSHDGLSGGEGTEGRHPRLMAVVVVLVGRERAAKKLVVEKEGVIDGGLLIVDGLRVMVVVVLVLVVVDWREKELPVSRS